MISLRVAALGSGLVALTGYMSVIAFVLALSACGGKQPRGKQGGGTVTVTEPTLDRDVPEMSATYQEAYDEAKKEITKDNANDKLDELEHDINKGK
jgi:hypothetical protein